MKRNFKKKRECVACGSGEIKERRRCEPCAIKYNRKRVKDYYKRSGRKSKKRYGIVKCLVCGEDMIKNRPNQVAHGKCRKPPVVENYSKLKRSRTGTTIARQKAIEFGLILDSKTDVHHINEDVIDNNFQNFMIVSRSNHSKLHRFLELKWQRLYQNVKEWNQSMVTLTKEWLSLNNMNVLVLTSPEQYNNTEKKSNSIYLYLQL